MAKVIKGEKRGRPGKWIVDFYDQDGKRRRETYDTQNEAKDALTDRLGGVRDRTYCAPAEIPTLQVLSEAWLTAKSSEGLKPRRSRSSGR